MNERMSDSLGNAAGFAEMGRIAKLTGSGFQSIDSAILVHIVQKLRFIYL
jgi:hypothetical protein